MGVYQVHTDDGSIYEVHTEDQPSSVPLAQSASQFLQKPSNALPLSPLPLVRGTQEAAKSYVAADKKYPTENLLPAVGAIAGGSAGVEIPIPLASTALAGLGAREGEKLRQGISSFRGNATPMTPDESNAEANKQGMFAAVSELGGSIALKGARKLLAPIIEKVSGNPEFMKSYIDLVKSKLASGATREEIQALVNKFKDTPIKDASDIQKPIQDFLEQRGASIASSPESALTPTQLENLKSAGASPSDIVAFENRAKGLPEEINKLARGAKKPLSSNMESFDFSANNPLAKIHNDLGNEENMTYAGLKNIQKNAGDFANFGGSDRTPQQEFAGKIYHDIGEKLNTVAKEGGFEADHQFVKEEGQKYYQRKFLDNILQEKGVRDLIDKNKLNYGALAKKLDLPDDEISKLFGSKANLIESLKNFAAQTNEGDLGNAMRMRGTTKGGIFGSMNLGGIKSSLNMPELLSKIAERNGLTGKIGLPSKFPYPNVTSKAVFPLVKLKSDYEANR